MTTSSTPDGSQYANQVGGAQAAAIAALPPEIQALLKPSKVGNRIQHALTWAARPDPQVVELHHKRNHAINRFEDIHNAPLAEMDAVARQITKRYRRRAIYTGAITSLPGGLWAVVATGVDVELTAVYSVRMAAMVAQAYGYDTSLLEEQAHLADVLALVAGVDSLRGVGNWLTREGLTHLLPDVLPKLLTRLSIQLTEDQASKLVGRIIPGIGAIVGAAVDYTFVRTAGQRSIAYYHQRYLEEHGLAAPAANALSAPSHPTVMPGGGGAVQIVPPGYGGTVEGSLVHAPASTPAAIPATSATQTAASSAATPLPHKHRRPPERVAVWLAIFAVLTLAITIAALFALTLLAISGVHQLLGH